MYDVSASRRPRNSRMMLNCLMIQISISNYWINWLNAKHQLVIIIQRIPLQWISMWCAFVFSTFANVSDNSLTYNVCVPKQLDRQRKQTSIRGQQRLERYGMRSTKGLSISCHLSTMEIGQKKLKMNCSHRCFIEFVIFVVICVVNVEINVLHYVCSIICLWIDMRF
jgi:hypothetical protein